MKMRSLSFFFLVLGSAAASAEEIAPLHEDVLLLPRENEMHAVDHLIAATAQKLEKQKELKALMQAYREQEDRFFQGDQSKQHATKLVRSARHILEIIKESHLEHLFTSEYLEGLLLFSSIAGKSTPP